MYEELAKWAQSKKGKDWNFANGEIHKLGWTNIASSIFTAEKAHEDHMHWAGQRTTVDAEATAALGGKTVHRCKPVNESSFRYESKNKDIDDGETVKVRV